MVTHSEATRWNAKVSKRLSEAQGPMRETSRTADLGTQGMGDEDVGTQGVGDVDVGTQGVGAWTWGTWGLCLEALVRTCN